MKVDEGAWESLEDVKNFMRDSMRARSRLFLITLYKSIPISSGTVVMGSQQESVDPYAQQLE